MKAVSKGIIPMIFTNSISRNLTLIFLFGFMVAVALVTAGVMLLNLLLS